MNRDISDHESADAKSKQAPDRRGHLEIFNQHRSLLFPIAYRMLGTVADAEDLVQETFIRWQGVSHTEVESPRAFLVTIVSRLCINHLQSARVQREEYFGQWLPEPLLTASLANPSDAVAVDESLSIGFLFLLERLTPTERAVFLLREVFEYDYGEIARITLLTDTNCRQVLRRARQRITQERPRFDPSPEKRDEMLEKFLNAATGGDMDGLIGLLAKDIVLYTDGGGKATALPQPIYGAENVARLLSMIFRKFAPEEAVIRRTLINGQAGILGYENGVAQTALILNVAEGSIRNVYIVRNPQKLTKIPSLSTTLVC